MLAISGFGQPLAVILVGLFILTKSLARNGVILWLGQTLATAARHAVSRLVFLFTLSAALHMGSTALALVGNMGPLALAAFAFVIATVSLRVDVQVIAVATAIGCSSELLTPMAHPVNLIMVGPGKFHFGDFIKAGA